MFPDVTKKYMFFYFQAATVAPAEGAMRLLSFILTSHGVGAVHLALSDEAAQAHSHLYSPLHPVDWTRLQKLGTGSQQVDTATKC